MSDYENKISNLLLEFAKDPNSASVISQAKDFDWQHGSIADRQRIYNQFIQHPVNQELAKISLSFGFPTWGWGGILSGSAVVGGGGGGGYLTNNTEGRGVGFGFGSVGLSIGGAVDFAFLNYRGKPSEYWGMFVGGYGQVHAVGGVGVFVGGLGFDPGKWQTLIFAVGAGLSMGAGGFIGGAWVM